MSKLKRPRMWVQYDMNKLCPTLALSVYQREGQLGALEPSSANKAYRPGWNRSGATVACLNAGEFDGEGTRMAGPSQCSL
jgi:hypothetical protein